MNKVHNNNSNNSNNNNNNNRLKTTTKLIPLQDNESRPRKRNNSLIPIEFMTNTTGEAGRECAALATVFGVPEYIDSKSLWDRQQQQQGKTGDSNSRYGYVAVNNVSVMSRPLSKVPKEEEDTTQTHAFPSYIDSVLDSVATFNPSLQPTPQASKSFSLPKIPTVSKFNDFLPEESEEFIAPANPSSVLIHPISRSHSCSTISTRNINQDLFVENEFILGPSEIFDFITFDDDERFIIWGPDPIALSSSMATTTLDRPSSYATLYNKQYERPELEGFSSNTTTTLNRSKSSIQSNPTRRFRFAKPLRHSFSSFGPKDVEKGSGGSSFLLKKAFGIKRNKHDTSDALSISSTAVENVPKVIEAATIHKLIEKLTSTLDYTFMTDFFLTYRDFIQATDLCQLLISRFDWAMKNNEEPRRIVKIRVFVIFRHWLSNYFVHDFLGNYDLRKILTDFLNQLSRHPLVKSSPLDQRIVKTLKRVVRRLKKLYYTRSSGASRVKIIAPPPPTLEQEQMGEKVRAKLAQNSIMRKTAIRMDMSSDHHGNMAVQDTRFAPVVVVGSLNKKKDTQSPSLFSGNSVHRRSEDTQSISIHQQSKVPDMPDAASGDMESVASGGSGDSFESDISAGKTIPDDDDEYEDEEDEDEENDDYQSQMQSSYIEPDENWLREQEETMEYFNSLSRQQQENQTSQPNVPTKDDNESKVSKAMHADKSDVTNQTSANPLAYHAQVPHQARHLPSQKWCRNSLEEQNRQKLEKDGALPDEILKELDADTSIGGLARHLSKKSIERRKSEKSLQQDDLAPSSAPSSTATSPFLGGTHVSENDIPEMPPLTADMFEDGIPATVKKKSKAKKGKKGETPLGSSNLHHQSNETFAAIPYEQTENPTQNHTQEIQDDKKHHKRKISRAISKVFKPSHSEEVKVAKQEIPPDNMEDAVNPTPSEALVRTNEEQRQQSAGRFVSLIAEQLRTNISRDEIDGTDGTTKQAGKEENNICKRMSTMLISDEDRRHSFELRRRRGASIDSGHHQVSKEDASNSRSKKSKIPKNGPVYLGQLDTRSIIESCTGNKASKRRSYREEDDCSDDDQSSSSSLMDSEKSALSDVQASSNQAQRMSMVSNNTRQVKIAEDHASVNESSEEPIASIPRHINTSTSSGKSFIMSYRTSKLASQFCFIERDVLVKVGWEELIHCRWTKMDANGKININYGGSRDDMLLDNTMADISYTRQLEKKRAEGQGIEHVIQRFNLVCLWVSSEIIKTRNLNDRVKLVEKFIRLAMKCKLYSNYATLVQILLGLQSPAVARLEKTWSKVSAKYQRQLNKLTAFTSPMKNWKHIRDSMTEVAEEYGNSPAEVLVEMPGTAADKQKFRKTRIKIPFGGCIPFLGIYLSDLVFNSEKPRYLKPNLENQRIYSANTARSMPSCLNQPLVNFRKYRVIATVIKRVLIFQGLAMRYAFDEDPILKDMCRHLEVLDATTIRELSAQLQ